MLALTLLAIAILMVLGCAIYLSLGLPAAVAIVLSTPSSGNAIPELLMGSVGSELLLAVPLFLLMGNLLGQSGIARHLIAFFEACIGHLPGGLALVTVAAAVFFAGVTGSTAAEIAAISRTTVPPMVEAGYDKGFALGLVAAGSTLGIMLPPSIPMILYGFLSGESVGKLFIAGVVPGLFIGTLLAGYSVLVSYRRKYGRQQVASWHTRRSTFWRAFPVLVLPVFIAATIYGGWATPTEAGALGAAYTLLVCTLGYRALNWAQFMEAARETVRITSMVYIIIAASDLLGFYLTYTRFPQFAAEWVAGLGLAPFAFLMAVNLLLIILGIPLEPPPILFMTLPILLPIVRALGIDPIHFAVLMVMNLQLAQISPPVGTSLYVLAGVMRIPSTEVFKGVMPFFYLMVGGLLVLTYWPPLSLWLGSTMR